MTRRVRISEQTPRRVGSKRRHQRRHVGITTGATTRSPRGVDGFKAGYDTTRPATQVGLRPVESGLGGHDDGVRGSTRAPKTYRRHFGNRDDRHCQHWAPSVVSTLSKIKARVSPINSKFDILFLRWTVHLPSMKTQRSDDRIIDPCDWTFRPWRKKRHRPDRCVVDHGGKGEMRGVMTFMTF